MVDLSSYMVSGSNNPAKQVSVTTFNGLLTAIQNAINASAGGSGAVGEVNAAGYDAEGDGVVDDRTALAAAATAAASSSIVVIPAGTYRVASNLTIPVVVRYAPGAQLVPDAGVNVHHTAGYYADDWQHCFDISASGSSVTGDKAPMGYVTPQHFGADPTDTAVDDRPAIEAATEYAALNVIRLEYATGFPVKFPNPGVGNYYLTKTREIQVARTTYWYGEVSPFLRSQGGSEIRGANGLDAIVWCFAPGTASGSSSYEPENDPGDPTPGIGKDFGGHRSRFCDLTFLPESGAVVRQGFVANAVHFMERCHFAGFTEAGWHGHAQSGSAANRFAAPGVGNSGVLDYAGTASVGGSVNGSVLTSCYAQDGVAAAGTEGGSHGFVTHGSIAGTVKFFGCDAAGNQGAGFLLNDNVGCELFGCHSAQNCWKVAGRGTTLRTTTASAISASATSFDVASTTNLATSGVNSYIAVVLDDGSSWVCQITGIAGTTLTVTPAAPSGATFGNSVYLARGFIPIKFHTSTTADEPGVGANWRTYWLESTATIYNGVWGAAKAYHPSGGVNVCDATARTTISAHYSEGGIEVGVIGRSVTTIVGGYGSVRAAMHDEFQGCKVVGAGVNMSAIGYIGQGVVGDATTEYGVQLGNSASFTGGRILNFGDYRDDSTNKASAVRFQWNPTRGRYGFTDTSNSSKFIYGISGTGFTGTGYTSITQAYLIANGLYLADGGSVATTVTRIRSATNLAAITDAAYGAAVVGDIWIYTSPSAFGAIGAVCITAGTIGSTAVLYEFGAIGRNGTVNTQSGTAYTAVLADGFSYVRFTNAGAVTFTIPPNSSVAYPTGTEINFVQAGAGAVTLSPGSGVTLNSYGADLTLAGQFAVGTAKKVGTNEWDIFGNF